MVRFIISFLLILLSVLGHTRLAAQQDWHVHDIAPATQAQDRSPTFALFIPRQNRYWKTNVQYAQAAADQLGAELEVHVYHDDGKRLIDLVRKACEAKVDYLIYQPYQDQDKEIFQIAEKHQVKVFTIKSPLSDSSLKPRDEYPAWIGQSFYDYELAGKTLIQELLIQANRKGVNEHHILAIEGVKSTQSSKTRVKGLTQYLESVEKLPQLTIVQGNWNGDTAVKVFNEHMKKHPETNIIWVASDDMAIRVAEEIQRQDMKKPMLVGSIGMSQATLQLIQSGHIDTLLGTNTVDPAMTITMLYDHYHGKDFASESLIFPMQLYPSNDLNFNKFLFFFAIPPQFVDFHQYSVTFNPQRSYHSYTFPELVDLNHKNAQKNVASNLDLTPEELAFLKANPIITVHCQKDAPPISFVVDGVPQGISIDYLRILEKRLGIRFEFVIGPTWDEFLTMIKNKEIDMMANIVKTDPPSEYILFTKPYIQTQKVILSRPDQPYTSLEQLKGKRVAVPKGFFMIDKLSKEFPEIILVDKYENVLECLKAVSLGEVEATVGTDVMNRYILVQNTITNVKITGEAKFGVKGRQFASLGVRDDWPIFHSILTKAMGNNPLQDTQSINQKWLGIMDESNVSEDQESADSGLSFWLTFLISLGTLFSLVSIGWVGLKFLGNRLPLGLKSSRTRLAGITVMTLFLSVAILGTTFGLMHIQNRILQEVSQQLVTLRNMTMGSMQNMVNAQGERLRRLSQDKELISLTQSMLLAKKTDNRTMLAESRERFMRFLKEEDPQVNPGKHISIIAPDKTTLASSRINLNGKPHPINWQYPDKLKKALNGSTVYVPVIYNVTKSEATENPQEADLITSAYLLKPIYAPNGQVLAVAALSSDAEELMSLPFKESRYGESGESYAFDKKGRLISSSRFRDDLISMGLLKQGQSEILNLSLFDPDHDLSNATTQEKLSREIALIYPVKRALNQNQGFSTFAYNDYRGVPVYGAWAWDKELEMGFITEIDQSEALSAYYSLRLIIILILCVATLLAFLLTGVFVWNGERVNQELMKARDQWEQVAQERTTALIQREQKFKAVFDQTFNRMAILNPEGEILEANMMALSDSIIPAEHLIGLPFWEWFQDNPSASDLVRDAIEQAKLGEFRRFELQYFGTSQQERILDITITRITDEQGNLLFLLPMGHDITDIRQAQVEISEQEEKFRAVFDQTAQRMALLDIDGRILEINQQASLDDQEADLVGEFFWECSWMAYSDQLKEKIQEVVLIARDGVCSRFEVEYYEPEEDSPRIIDFSTTTVYDQAGAPLFILCMGHDITDLKQAQSALAQNQIMLELCFNSVSSLIMAIDLDLKYTYVNQAYAKTLSVTTDEMIGKTAADFYPEVWVERFAAINRKVINSRQPAKFIYSESEIIGTGSRIFDTQTHPLLDTQDEVIGIVTIAHDVSALQLTQMELERNRTLLQLLFDTIPDLVFLKDPHGCYTFANSAFLQLLNCNIDELIGTTDHDYFPAAQADIFVKEDKYILENHETNTFNNTLEMPDRTSIYETIKRPLINNEGIAIGVIGIARDVTEVKQIQTELEQNRSLLQALFDSIPDLVFVKDLQGRYTYVNAAFAESVNLDKTQIINLTDHDMYDEEWARIFVTQDEEVKSSQAIISYENTGQLLGKYSIRDTLKQPFLDAQGQTIGIMGISRDITDRKLAEKIIRESEERLRFSLVAMEAYYWVSDLESNTWHYDSDQFFVKYGYQVIDIPDSIEGFHSLIHPDDLHAIHDEFIGYLDSHEQSHRTEFRFKHSNGSWVWIENIGQALERHEDGRLKKMVGLSLDITDRKNAEVQLKSARLESERNAKELAFALQNSEKLRDEADQAKLQAEEAARIKTEFLATMSHEIRTPMNGVLGMVQLLMESQLNQKQRQHLETIYSSGNALLAIINDILDLSKLEANRMTLDLTAYDPRQIVLAAVNLMLNRADHKGLAIHCHVDDLVPKALVGDANRIRQVLLNFISNAIKFTDEGEVSIRVYAVQEDNAHWLRYEVADTGIGISDQNLHKLFHEFSQVDSTISRHYEGTGLGLAICKKFVELMGGVIGVDSQEEQGSCFWFKIPAMESNEDPDSPELSTNRLSHLRLPPLNILLAEDNVVNQEVTEAFLMRDHHHVTIVSNGKQAVEAFEENDFDVILMDMRMPEMDGVQATKVIRSMPKPKSKVPIIALTASVKRGDESSCKDAGMNGYVSKPIQLNLLMQAIVNATGIQPLIQEISKTEMPNIPSELIDMKQLKLILDISSQDSLIHIIRTYLTEMLPEIEALQSLIESQQWLTVKQSAHRIKGASANLALTSIASLMLEIEELIEEEEYEELQTSSKRIPVVTNATLMELKSLYPKAFQQDDPTAQPSTHEFENLSQSELIQLMNEFAVALKSSQPQQISRNIEPLKGLKLQSEQQKLFNKVISLVEAYQYHKAYDMLNTLIDQLEMRRQDSD